MASRKTYFGIGWSKDAPDPDSGAVGKTDPDDRSAPTIVDDEKVAEGLRQLRSWYQGDSQSSRSQADASGSAPAPAPVPASEKGAAARPTAVGHATAPPASVFQRPVAPDPMRATMYGHDVHKFDLEAELAAQKEQEQRRQQQQQQAEPQLPPPAPTTALVVADPARQQEMYRQHAEGIPHPTAASASDSFQLARFGVGEAERLPPRPARRSGAYEAPRPTSRVPLASRVMFGVGLVALAVAVVFWLQSGGSDSTATAPPPPPVPAVQPPPSIPPAPAPERATAPAPVPERPSMAATPTPIPAAPVTQPRTEQLRLSAGPAPARTPHRHREIKPVVDEPTEVDEAPAAPPSVADKELREPSELKDIKPLSADKAAKAPEEAKEQKRAPTPAKESKAAKTRPGDDATLPPSLE